MSENDATIDEQALRLAVGRREEQLETALKDLVRVAEDRASLGHYVARHPWHFLVGAFVVGVWLGKRR